MFGDTYTKLRASLYKPGSDMFKESGEGNGIRFGFCCTKGRRIDMEDTHSIHISLPAPLEKWSYFGVFDGHSGVGVAEACATELLETMLNSDQFKSLQESSDNVIDFEKIKQGIIESFLKFDKSLLSDTYNVYAGSTAVIAFITPTHIIFANCGDSRAILVRDDKTYLATEDHKPTLEAETERITKAGGHIQYGRVNSVLSVSRALGDLCFKDDDTLSETQQFVSPEPDVYIVERDRDHDQVLIMACDGVWDEFANDELATYVLQRLRCKADLDVVCEEILDTTFSKGSPDNMSVLMVALEKAPQLDLQLARKDEELDELILFYARKNLESRRIVSENLNMDRVYDVVRLKDLPNYPPGGFITKQRLVTNLCKSFIWERMNSHAESDDD